MKDDEDRKINEANKEIAEFVRDPFKDPMQEMIDQYATMAEEKDGPKNGGNKTKNSTIVAAQNKN